MKCVSFSCPEAAPTSMIKLAKFVHDANFELILKAYISERNAAIVDIPPLCYLGACEAFLFFFFYFFL